MLVLFVVVFVIDINNIVLYFIRLLIEILDRNVFGILFYFEVVKGVYIINDFDLNRRKDGMIIVRGISIIYNLIKFLF